MTHRVIREVNYCFFNCDNACTAADLGTPGCRAAAAAVRARAGTFGPVAARRLRATMSATPSDEDTR